MSHLLDQFGLACAENPAGIPQCKRTLAAGACGTVVFSFANNANTNLANYSGSLTFSPFGPVPIL